MSDSDKFVMHCAAGNVDFWFDVPPNIEPLDILQELKQLQKEKQVRLLNDVKFASLVNARLAEKGLVEPDPVELEGTDV